MPSVAHCMPLGQAQAPAPPAAPLPLVPESMPSSPACVLPTSALPPAPLRRRHGTRCAATTLPLGAESTPSIGRDETPEQALERRVRESKRVEERVTFVHSNKDWDRGMAAAGNNLVVVEVQGESVCQVNMDDVAEYHWKDEAKQARLEALKMCSEIKHTFQRVARDSPDATFLSFTIGDEPTPEESALVDRLGIEVLPTLQFWRNGVKLWEQKGAQGMDSDLAEGVLFYDGSMADGVQAKDFVRELHTREHFDAFVSDTRESHVLKVVNMALTTAAPCIHVYPAVLALAKNFVGFAQFARVMGDEGPEGVKLLREHKIVEVPTFLFFRDGREVGRHVGSSRADLIGKILQIQQNAGIAPPPRPGVGKPVPRPKMMRRV